MTDALIDAAVVGWIERTAGGTVVELTQVAGGGRSGFAVDVEAGGIDAGDAVRRLFLQRGGRGGVGSFMGFAREAEVYGALEPLGIPIPHVWGVDEDLDVFLVDRAEGQVWFRPPRDHDVAVAVARNFMRHLATWHAAPARALELPSFGPVRSVQEHQRDQLAGIEAMFEREDQARPIDALARAQLAHLVDHVPDYDGEPVLVQGDTGPGNFMYDGARVTAIVDWELAHIGDPMDDIAWLSWRATQQGWPDFPARLREYEAASGIEVDPARVRYYRLNACARLGPRFGLADMGEGTTRPLGPAGAVDAAIDRYADGSGLVMNMLHRRMRLTAQADAVGIELPGREVSDEAPPLPHAALYDAVLAQLRGVVERVDDRAASNLAKGAARQVKYLKELDRNRSLFEERELDDLGRLLGHVPTTVESGRTELATAARDGKVELDDYLLYHWARLVRDDWMMREASGAMYERGWPALVG
ncbi:MAG TPA: phosphotransferase family protein [Acidimicrobiia bacterium]|jgi:aminoglycoside phosphotransferase (APT) family kinase protein|nr:phosphotransferase family protein [Acidimicrobiia bacterium]